MLNDDQVSYRYENRQRNRLYGLPYPNAIVDTSVLADKVRLLDDVIGTSREMILIYYMQAHEFRYTP